MSRAAPVPYAVGFLSADGRWRWDGFQWQPVQIGEKTHDELVESAAYAAVNGHLEVPSFGQVKVPTWMMLSPA